MSPQIPNQNSDANKQKDCQQSDKLRRLCSQINLLTTQMVKACGSNLPTRNVGGDAVTLPTSERNNWHNNATEKIAKELKKTLENDFNNSLNDARWHTVLGGPVNDPSPAPSGAVSL